MNSINSEGAATVSEFVASDPSVKELYLGPMFVFSHHDDLDIHSGYSNINDSERNKFADDASAALFAGALRNNTKLHVLSLPNQCFPLDSLDKAFFDSSSLMAAFTSNHTCRIVNNRGVQPEVNTSETRGWWYVRKELLSSSDISASVAKWKVLQALKTALQTSQSIEHVQNELKPAVLEFAKEAGVDYLSELIQPLEEHLDFLADSNASKP